MLWLHSVPVKLAALAVICAATAGATSCESEGPGPTFVTDLVLENAAGEVRQQFAEDEPITLELTVRNRGDDGAVLQFTSGQQFEFIVVDAGTSRVRWTWSSDKLFLQSTTELVFAPGQTHTFTTTWNQSNLGRGNYEARGVLLFSEFGTNPLAAHQLGSPLKAFTIN